MAYTVLVVTEQSEVGQRLLGKKTIIRHNKCYVVVQHIWPDRKGQHSGVRLSSVRRSVEK